MAVNVMLDLETFGTTPDSAILSIGATTFGHGDTQPHEFYQVVSRRSCEQLGFRFDRDTMDWWQRQSDKAREVLRQCETLTFSNSVMKVLTSFRDYLMRLECVSDGPPLIWGNGSDFDNALLQFATFRCGLPPLWGHRQNRCYRTLKNLAPNVPLGDLQDAEVEHHALHDARRQARHASAILRAIENGTKR